MTKFQILQDFEHTLMLIEDVLGTGVTTNTQLLKLGKQIFGDRFKNVYCADDRITLINGQCCIMNTDSSNQRGTHWISLFKHRDHYYVFDSFGSDAHTLSKYFKYKKWINVEFHRIESYKASSCGELSMAFLVLFDRCNLIFISINI